MAATPFELLPHGKSLTVPRDRGARYAGLAAAVFVHAVLIVALLQYAPVRRSIARVAPIMVSAITPPPPEAPRPIPKLPLTRKPAPTETPPPAELPRYAPPAVTQSTAVSPITLPPAPPPSPVAEIVVAPDPPPVIPPRFNADYLQNPAPAYPALARRMHEQGRVLIRVLVSVDGLPERVELKTSSGFPRLDQSALETIRNWKFVPARQGDQKIAAWVVVPIAFTLDVYGARGTASDATQTIPVHPSQHASLPLVASQVEPMATLESINESSAQASTHRDRPCLHFARARGGFRAGGAGGGPDAA